MPPNVDPATKTILKQYISSPGAALAELKEAAELIPNPSGLINMLLLEGCQAVQKRRLTAGTAEEICSPIEGVQMQCEAFRVGHRPRASREE